MKVNWFRRRAHTRRLKSGTVANVRESWVARQVMVKAKRGSYRHPCPICGAGIISVKMPNGGWAHFEGQAGLTKIKHPCLHIGESIGRAKDELTFDLFEAASESDGHARD